VAVNAVWQGATRRVVLTFNMGIQPPESPLDLTNWKLSYGGGTKVPTSATVEGNVVTLQFTTSLGVSQIAYDPPPFDVVAVEPNGLPAAGFAMPL
jgi:hypothetical protein